MINENLNELRERLEACDELLSNCVEELDLVGRKLSEVRQRQKLKFGDLLLRTTLNHRLSDLLDDCQRENNGETH